LPGITDADAALTAAALLAETAALDAAVLAGADALAVEVAAVTVAGALVAAPEAEEAAGTVAAPAPPHAARPSAATPPSPAARIDRRERATRAPVPEEPSPFAGGSMRSVVVGAGEEIQRDIGSLLPPRRTPPCCITIGKCQG